MLLMWLALQGFIAWNIYWKTIFINKKKELVSKRRLLMCKDHGDASMADGKLPGSIYLPSQGATHKGTINSPFDMAFI